MEGRGRQMKKPPGGAPFDLRPACKDKNHAPNSWGADQKARKNPQGSAPCGYEKAPDFSEAVVFV